MNFTCRGNTNVECSAFKARRRRETNVLIFFPSFFLPPLPRAKTCLCGAANRFICPGVLNIHQERAKFTLLHLSPFSLVWVRRHYFWVIHTTPTKLLSQGLSRHTHTYTSSNNPVLLGLKKSHWQTITECVLERAIRQEDELTRE